MVVLENKLHFIKDNKITLQTDSPIAINSNDHIIPHGTIRDNTRFPRFIRKCEILFPQKESLSFLDLGCSGGGMVLDAILRNHFAIGIEGSDSSLIMQRAEWRLLKNNLYTCDVTKPFDLQTSDNNNYKFDIITAWEVLEHISEQDLDQMFKNIANHMHSDSLFIATIAAWDDIDSNTGTNWHVTVKPLDWWKDKFISYGFSIQENLFTLEDYPRAGYNPPNCYEDPDNNYLKDSFKEKNYKIVLKRAH